MNGSQSNSGLLKKAYAFLRLAEKLVDAGHDEQALARAQTILDRSEKAFAVEPLIEKSGVTMCSADGFVAIQRLLKLVEGPDGAALDGGGHEPDLARAGRRFGTAGMPFRREAFRHAARLLEHAKSWNSPREKIFAGAGMQWRWRDSGWLPRLPLTDGSQFFFQPLVVMIAPTRAVLERSAIVLEQLCAPPAHLPSNVGKAFCEVRRSPYAAAVLLDTTDAMPADALRFARFLIKAREGLSASDRTWPKVHVLVLEPAAAGTLAPEAALLERLTGREPDLASMATRFDPGAGFVSEPISSRVELLLSREQSLHHVAAHLWREYAAAEPAVETMNRARKIRPGVVPEPESSAGAATNASPLYIFPHIPKTAGTSVYSHLRRHLELGREFITFPADGGPYRLEATAPFTLRPLAERQQARMIFGHGVLKRHADFAAGRPVREITTLRDPAEQIVSNYNFTMGQNEKAGGPVIPFEEWYALEPRNFQATWLLRHYLQETDDLAGEALLARSAEVLEAFWLVCTVENLAEDLNRLFAAMELPPFNVRINVAGVHYPRRRELDAALRRRLAEENPVDFELHRRWRERSRG